MSLFKNDLSTPIQSLTSQPPSHSAPRPKPKEGVSYIAGDKSEPLHYATIPEIFEKTAAQFASRDAAIFYDKGLRWSYGDLARHVDDLAAGLLALGLQKGERIGIWSPNRPEWLVTQFATAKIGLVLVNINPAYRSMELAYALNQVQCKALIAAASFKTSNYVEMLQDLAPELAHCAPGKLKSQQLPHLETIVQLGEEKVPGFFNYNEVLQLAGPAQKQRLEAVAATLDPDDSINIQFTSGTTGSPKGATLTHYNILNNAHFNAKTLAFTEQDKLCIPVPLYHCFGMVLGTLTCVMAGATMVFPSESFEARITLEAVAAEKCTALHGVPTMFIAQLDHPDFGQFDLSSLRTGMMAGAPCPMAVMEKVIEQMHMSQITIGYGMTETSPLSFQTRTDDALEKRVSTVGQIHPHVEVKIIDANGAIVPLGKPGELCTRGYSVMKGYWDDEEKTKETIDATGWMHTGDLATLDAEGYCNIVGRIKEMVIRGGENIYPKEIEDLLYRHPKIQDVQVFGLPDKKYGEELCAWIVLQSQTKATEEEIKQFFQGQIAHYKIPRYMRFVESLPMTVTGKPQKFVMQKKMLEELGL